MGKTLSRIRLHPVCAPICGPACFGVFVQETGDTELGVASNDTTQELLVRDHARRAYRHVQQNNASEPQEDGESFLAEPAASLGLCFNVYCHRRALLLTGVCLLIGLLLLLSLAKATGISARLVAHDEPAPTVNYDCEDGLSVWEVDWSTPKMDWCCWNYGVGCMHFNCEGDGSSWTDLQSKWCCEVRGIGSDCVSGSLRFDCGHNLDSWQSWHREKKKWCCDYQGLGCGEEFEDGKEQAAVAKAAADAKSADKGEAPVAPEHEAEGPVSTTLFTGCQSECVIDEVQATCSDWVVDFAKVAYRGKHDACSEAYTLMRVKCGKSCDDCPITVMNCEALNSLPPPDDSDHPDVLERLKGKEEEGAEHHSGVLHGGPFAGGLTKRAASSGCVEGCVVRGSRASCADWVADFARGQYRGQANSCAQAYTRMRVDCGTACDRCPMDAIDCQTLDALPAATGMRHKPETTKVTTTTTTKATSTAETTTTMPIAAKAVLALTTTTTTTKTTTTTTPTTTTTTPTTTTTTIKKVASQSPAAASKGEATHSAAGKGADVEAEEIPHKRDDAEHDCSNDAENWLSWPMDKKLYCCHVGGMQCPF